MNKKKLQLFGGAVCSTPLRPLSLVLAAVGLLSLPAFAQLSASALPSGGVVAAGSAAISQSGTAMRIDQTSNKAIIDWQSFNIGRDASVRFYQPSASSITLNRVGADGGRSIIDGSLSATGQVWLLNPGGTLFGPTAHVDVGGLLASSLKIGNDDFMGGNYLLTKDGAGSVVNQGTLTAADGGYIALLAPEVRNEGVISARLGTVALASGDELRVDFSGDRLIEIKVDQATVNGLIENKNLIEADGGWVLMSADAANRLSLGAINNTGIVRATTLSEHKGVIKLLAGTTSVGGTLDASAPNGGDGGFIETSGHTVHIDPATHVTTTAPHGKTGTWLIDPNDYTIAASGGDITGALLGSSLDSTNMTIATATMGTSGGNGDIFVNDAVSWSSGNNLTLQAERNVTINSNIAGSNVSSSFAAYAPGTLTVAGNVTSGLIAYKADNMDLTGASTTTSGGLMIDPFTDTRAVRIETTPTANTLSLSPTELMTLHVSSGYGLSIGRTALMHSLAVTAALAGSDVDAAYLGLGGSGVAIDAPISIGSKQLFFSADNVGVLLNAPITTSSYVGFDLRNGGSVSQGANAPVSAQYLMAMGNGSILLADPGVGNKVQNVSADITGAFQLLNDTTPLAVSTLPWNSGIHASNINLQTQGNLTLNAPLATSGVVQLETPGTLTIASTSGVNAAVVYLHANDMDLVGTTTATTGNLTIAPYDATRALRIEATPTTGVLSLTSAEIATLHATGTNSEIHIGDLSSSSALTVATNLTSNDVHSPLYLYGNSVAVDAAITLYANAPRFGFVVGSGGAHLNAAVSVANEVSVILNANGQLDQTSGAALSAGLLKVSGTGGVLLNGVSNRINTIAAQITGDFQLVNASANPLQVVSAGSATGPNTGISANNIALITSGDLVLNAPLIATTGVSLQTPGTLTITNTSNVNAVDVNYLADNMTLTGATSASGRVVMAPLTAGRAIWLGAGDSSTNLGLDDAELKTVTSASVLQVGNASSGNIDIKGSVTPTVATLSLQTGGDIRVANASGFQISANNLALRAAGDVDLLGVYHPVNTLAASLTGAGKFIRFHAGNALTVGNVDGISGITTNNGDVALRTFTGDLTVANNINVGSGLLLLETSTDNSLFTLNTGASLTSTYGGALTLANACGSSAAICIRADRMTIDGSIAAVNQAVLLGTSGSRAVELGVDDINAASTSGGTLGLTNAELNRINANLVGVGNDYGGTANLSVIGAVNLTSAPNLALVTSGNVALNAPLTVTNNLNVAMGSGGNLTQVAAAPLTANTMAVLQGNSVQLGTATGGNSIGSVAGTVSGAFNVTNGATPLVVSNISNQNGILSGSNGITLTGGGPVSVNAPVTATTGDISLMSVGALTVNSPVAVTSGNFTMVAGGNSATSILTLNSLVTASGFAFNNNDLIADSDIRINAPLAVGSGNLQLSAGHSIDFNANVTSGGPNLVAISGTNPSIAPGIPTMTIASGATLNAGTGLVTLDHWNGRFINNNGDNAISISGAGHWQISTDDPSTTTEGFSSYNKMYNTTGPGQFTARPGNWFYYTIAPVLNVAASAQSMTYGDAFPGFTPVYNGLIDGDTALTAVSGTAAFSVNGAVSSSGNAIAGIHDVRYTSGLTSGLGYTIQNNAAVTNELTVSQKNLAVTGLSASSKVYDATTIATLVGTAAVTPLSSVASPDLVTVGGVAIGRFTDKNAGLTKAVTVTGNTLGGADAGNYTLVQASGLSADITRANLIVSGLAASNKVYDANTTATLTGTATVTPLSSVAGPDVVTIGGIPAGAFADSNVGNSKVITVNGNTIVGGADAGNYNLVQQSGLRANIMAVPVKPVPDTVTSSNSGSNTAQATVSQQSTATPTAPTTTDVGSSGASMSNFPTSATAQAASAGTALPVALPKLIVDATKSLPKLAGVLNRVELQAMSLQVHEARTQLFADALSILEKDPKAADIADCAAGGGELCIAKSLIPAAQDGYLPVVKRKIALMIGNNAYHSPIPDLETAINDVSAISTQLRDQLGYEVKVIENASRKDIIEALNDLIRTTGRDDSVMVMYAGHGYLNDATKTGYWIPTDASISNPDQWISNSTIARALGNIPAKQVMLVSDSCYSGSLTTEGKVIETAGISREQTLTRRSVLAFSSGGEEPVTDEGHDDHSIFAWNMIESLKQMKNETSGQQLHATIKEAVAKEFPQVPQYGTVVSAGHAAGGEYLLTPNKKGAK